MNSGAQVVHSHFNLLYNWTCIHEKNSFVRSSLMLLSERLISSLETVLQSQTGAFRGKKLKAVGLCVYPAEAAVICIKGQQSACNYRVTSANGSEEST